MVSTPQGRPLRVIVQCPDVSEETTLQLFGILDVACIATKNLLFTVTRVGPPLLTVGTVFYHGTELSECTPHTLTLRVGILHILQWI